ncbi:nicotinamide N-methyltransferase-like [Rana temporaria]|uniref:nicotinamide N-methyltransferase-like n=1 Tax=Rana temporaria TaxID=8407 RepID=UPI001AAD53EF|nr:nicotinamide N-methyltransferase-like [Rana temporaria]
MAHGSHSQNSREMPFTPEEVKNYKERFSKAISSGHNKGDVLINISSGINIDYLDSAKKNFKEIIILQPTDSQTRNSTELAGKSDQPEGKETEHGHEEAIIRVVKFDLNKENPTDPNKLPQADSMVVGTVLETMSGDIKEYVRYLRKIASLLKPKGHLIMFGVLNGTFYKAGGEKFHVVKYNEDDLRNILTNEGFVITNIEVSQRKVESDLMDSDSVVFCTADKGPKSYAA